MLPLEPLSQLAATAATEMKELYGAERVAGVAKLEGLCAWARDTSAWEGFAEPSRGACEAIAHNRPRPGHSARGRAVDPGRDASPRRA